MRIELVTIFEPFMVSVSNDQSPRCNAVVGNGRDRSLRGFITHFASEIFLSSPDNLDSRVFAVAVRV
jgi:hypothetical protein